MLYYITAYYIYYISIYIYSIYIYYIYIILYVRYTITYLSYSTCSKNDAGLYGRGLEACSVSSEPSLNRLLEFQLRKIRVS